MTWKYSVPLAQLKYLSRWLLICFWKHVCATRKQYSECVNMGSRASQWWRQWRWWKGRNCAAVCEEEMIAWMWYPSPSDLFIKKLFLFHPQNHITSAHVPEKPHIIKSSCTIPWITFLCPEAYCINRLKRLAMDWSIHIKLEDQSNHQVIIWLSASLFSPTNVSFINTQ